MTVIIGIAILSQGFCNVYDVDQGSDVYDNFDDDGSCK